MPYTGDEQPCDIRNTKLENPSYGPDRPCPGSPSFATEKLPPGTYYDPAKFHAILPKVEGASYDPGVPKSEQGVKYDMAKPDYSLLPPYALEDVVKVLTLGSQKYSRDNWKLLNNARMRYFAAAMRHLWARFRGEITDPESGIDHGAHAVCCILFMMEMTHENIDP